MRFLEARLEPVDILTASDKRGHCSPSLSQTLIIVQPKEITHALALLYI
jgi:hypothetical protein